MNDGSSPAVDPRLLESEQRYQAVIENASDMIQSVRPDGTFEFVNRAWRNALAYSDDDLARMTIWDIVHADAVDHCLPYFMRAINGEEIPFLETVFVAKDGHTVPVEGSVTSRFVGDEVVATHGFFRDITERLRARELEERAVMLEREERARYLEKMAALGKLSAGLAHELNNPAAAVQRANAGLRETIRRRDAAMREMVAAGLAPEDWQLLEAMIDRARQSERATDPIAASDAEADLENWMDERGVDRAWELAPALADAGFTERDAAEIERQLTAAALPGAMRWLNETLLLDGSTEIIGQSSRRIADLVQAIKGYSHMDRATEHEADVHDGLENTLIILAHRLGNVDVQRQYDRSLPPIRVYGNTLNQVWTNILDNAIDAMNGTGRIIIKTSLVDDQVQVCIEDNGCGIPPEALPRIFEPFYTSKPQGQGTGLGLDTVWRIVTTEHGGTITAESEPGRTTFHVRLPVTGPAT